MARTLVSSRVPPAVQARFARAGLDALGTLAPRLATRVVLRLFRTPRRARFQATPFAGQLRAEGRPFTLLHGTGTLDAVAWGAGPTVVLVHGWESDSDSMLHFVSPLTAQGLRVVAFDGPAHGRSSGTQTDLLDFGRAIVTIARHVGPVHAFVGHSFGAAATLLVLAESAELAPYAMASLGAPIELDYMITVFSATLGLRAPLIARMREAIHERFGPPQRFSIPAVAGRIRTRGLVIHDRGDRRVPFAHAEALVRAWPASTLFATEGLGHRATLRDAAVIDRVTAFVVSASEPVVGVSERAASRSP